MPLPDNFESLWAHAASEETFQTLVSDLESYISQHWCEEQDSAESLLLRLLRQSDERGVTQALKAFLSQYPLNLKNESLIERLVQCIDDPSPQIRQAVIQVLGRLASESEVATERYRSILMAKLERETDVGCRDRLLVYAETSITDARMRLAKVCLGETADRQRGPWREMFVLDELGKLNIRWRDWVSFLEKLLPTMEEWGDLAWMAFCGLAASAGQRSSLYRALVERISELMRIAERVEERNEFATNLGIRYVLTEMIGPMSRRRKKNVLAQNIGFFVDTIKYDDPGISTRCLELFAEVSIVPLLSTEQRTHLLNHEDDVVRELAEELFVRISEEPPYPGG